MAEWLRRWTRNPMGSPRAGSNPARSDLYFPFLPIKLWSLTRHTAIFFFISEKVVLHPNVH